jgi:AcrR family transcriptional regulator
LRRIDSVRQQNPTKGERTRARIVAKVAPLFNERGFAGASMADLIGATGLRAGGVYRHFDGKEALAIAAFDHAAATHWTFYQNAVAGATTAAERIAALAGAMASIVDTPLIAGGCPLLNAAIEMDDARPAMPALRTRVRRAMNTLIGLARTILADGIAAGEIAPSVDAAAEARLVIATMEGAIMLAKLFDDPSVAREAAVRVAERAHALSLDSGSRRRARRPPSR